MTQPAEAGTIMEQGLTPEVWSEKLREFSKEDAELLQKALNTPPL